MLFYLIVMYHISHLRIEQNIQDRYYFLLILLKSDGDNYEKYHLDRAKKVPLEHTQGSWKTYTGLEIQI